LSDTNDCVTRSTEAGAITLAALIARSGAAGRAAGGNRIAHDAAADYEWCKAAV
jgi:hypothetical protein